MTLVSHAGEIHRVRRVPMTVKRKKRGRPVKCSPEFIASIPDQLRSGKTIEQLAASVHCEVSTLLVHCYRKHITLPDRTVVRTFVKIKRETAELTQKHALAMGLTYSELIGRLMDIIAKDGIFDAILDGDG